MEIGYLDTAWDGGNECKRNHSMKCPVFYSEVVKKKGGRLESTAQATVTWIPSLELFAILFYYSKLDGRSPVKTIPVSFLHLTCWVGSV